MASPSIISYGTGFGDLTTTVSTSIGGTLDDDVVLLLAGCDNGLDVTGVTGTAMAAPWAKLIDVTSGGSGNDNGACSLWSARVPAATPSVSVTATFSGTAHLTAAILFNVRGCALVSPFDPNVSLPAGQGGNPPGTITYSTTESNDLLIAFRAGHIASPFAGMPAGWTKLAFVANSGLLAFMTEVVGYKSVSAPQVSQTYNDDANFGSFGCIGIAALTADTSLNPPGVPTGEACGTATTTSITAIWTAGSGGTPVSYSLQWRPVGSGPFTLITGITGTSQVISALSPGISYEWQVAAINADGSSGFSTSTICSTLSIAPSETPQSVSLGRWRGQVGINWLGLALVGDAFTGIIGRSDFQNFTEYGNVLRMLVTSPPLNSNRHRIFVPRFEVDMQVGDGLAGAPRQAPVMMLDYSKDGGMTFVGLQKWRSTGRVGQYTTRLRWLNMGQSRSWVFRLQMTDAARRQIIGAYLDSYEGLG